MGLFQYDKTDIFSQYYELLEELIERWEFESLNLKKQKGSLILIR